MLKLRHAWFLSLAFFSFVLLGASREARAYYDCGPYYQTYSVQSLDSRVAYGVRCLALQVGDASHPNIPTLYWYGEGMWNTTKYRHLGHAFFKYRGISTGYADDFYGNGENTSAAFNGNITLTFSNSGAPWPDFIIVSGAWNEKWVRMPNRQAPYNSVLGPVNHCGPNFREYAVDSLNPANRGAGVRCIMKAAPLGYRFAGYFTWYGHGFWNGVYYTHMGTHGLSGFGAADFCRAGEICGAASFGSLYFTPQGSSYRVSGAWSEYWRFIHGLQGMEDPAAEATLEQQPEPMVD